MQLHDTETNWAVVEIPMSVENIKAWCDARSAIDVTLPLRMAQRKFSYACRKGVVFW